jgi:hypothetical protein
VNDVMKTRNYVMLSGYSISKFITCFDSVSCFELNAYITGLLIFTESISNNPLT